MMHLLSVKRRSESIGESANVLPMTTLKLLLIEDDASMQAGRDSTIHLPLAAALASGSK
jgi:hypothetical protein